jgi:hypothetical protein
MLGYRVEHIWLQNVMTLATRWYMSVLHGSTCLATGWRMLGYDMVRAWLQDGTFLARGYTACLAILWYILSYRAVPAFLWYTLG